MRFELAGTLTPTGSPGPGNPSNPPPVILAYTANDTLDVKHYADLGYTAFDVICIGAGGGAGGGYKAAYDSAHSGQKHWGGAGGGGGAHLVSGSLLTLPDSVAIVVGLPGADGTWEIDPNPFAGGGSPSSDPQTLTGNTDGVDGGASTFNGATCRASGGKGGKRVQQIAWAHVSWTALQSDGGDGGVGNSTIAGGGGSGGKQVVYSTTTGAVVTSGVPAADGTWDGTVGQGGGGGYGGGILITSPTAISSVFAPGLAGSGSATGADPLIYYFNHYSYPDPEFFAGGTAVAPGGGGGEWAAKITSIATGPRYGNGSHNLNANSSGVAVGGIVAVRLYAK